MAPFSTATTPKYRGGCFSIPWLLHFTLDHYLISAIFSIGMTRPGMEHRYSGPLANINILLYNNTAR